MKRPAASLALLLVAAASAAPAPAPHCSFARDPVITCNGPDQAAAAWHLYGFDMRAVRDSNNRALLARAGCAVTDRDAARHLILESRRGRLATQWGWTGVSLIDIDGYIDVWVATPYLRGTCEKWSSEAGDRNKALLKINDPRMPTRVAPSASDSEPSMPVPADRLPAP